MLFLAMMTIFGHDSEKSSKDFLFLAITKNDHLTRKTFVEVMKFYHGFISHSTFLCRRKVSLVTEIYFNRMLSKGKIRGEEKRDKKMNAPTNSLPC